MKIRLTPERNLILIYENEWNALFLLQSMYIHTYPSKICDMVGKKMKDDEDWQRYIRQDVIDVFEENYQFVMKSLMEFIVLAHGSNSSEITTLEINESNADAWYGVCNMIRIQISKNYNQKKIEASLSDPRLNNAEGIEEYFGSKLHELKKDIEAAYPGESITMDSSICQKLINADLMSDFAQLSYTYFFTLQSLILHYIMENLEE